MRALHSPVNVAGGPGAISAGLRELGVESTLLVFNERPFERGFDVNLELRDTSRLTPCPSTSPSSCARCAGLCRASTSFTSTPG